MNGGPPPPPGPGPPGYGGESPVYQAATARAAASPCRPPGAGPAMMMGGYGSGGMGGLPGAEAGDSVRHGTAARRTERGFGFIKPDDGSEARRAIRRPITGHLGRSPGPPSARPPLAARALQELFCHYSSIRDGNALEDGAKVEYVKVFDERRGKARAEQVTGTKVDRGGGLRAVRALPPAPPLPPPRSRPRRRRSHYPSLCARL